MIAAAKTAWKNKDPIVILITVIIIVFVFRWATNFIPKKLKEMRKANTLSKDGKNNATNDSGKTVDLNTIARSYRNAFNPSGILGFLEFDGTNEEGVYQAARDSAGIFDQVAAVYSNIYEGDNLLDDLNSELNAEELAKALELARLSGHQKKLIRLG